MTEALKDAVAEAVANTTATSPEGVARAVEAEVRSDPVLVNELGQERWWQSGVTWGGAAGVFSALGVLFTEIGQWGTAEFEWGVFMPALGTLWSAAYVLYRRWWPGLTPLLHGWFGA